MNVFFSSRKWESLKPVWDFLRPFIFPEFHRKITRRTLYTGIFLVVGTPFIQWLIQSLLVAGISTALNLPLAPLIESLDDGQKFGFWLIIASLTYSAIVLWVQSHEAREKRVHVEKERQNILKRDYHLYRAFLEQFGSDEALDTFVCHHNFDAAYRREQSYLLHDFVNTWSAPEKCFQQREIAESFGKLFESMQNLSSHLATYSGPLRASTDLYGIVDRSVHNDFELPAHVKEAVKFANQLGSKVFTQRQDFIRLAESYFATLPDKTT